MTAAPPRIAPVKAKVRIETLDVIRGVSILGILAVNADGYAAPMLASLKPEAWIFPNQFWTTFSYWVMDAFFHEKFVTIFSMLFGISLFLVGGERTDKTRSRLLWRRLGALVLFAMLHGFGIWWGDILSLYAVTGCIMFFCRSWSHGVLLAVGVALLAAPSLANVLPLPDWSAVYNGASHGIPHSVRVANDLAEASGSWAGAYRVNTRSYLHLLHSDMWLMQHTLGLMMIGLSLFKSGFVAGKWSEQRYRGILGMGTIALGIVAWILWEKDMAGVRVFHGADIEAVLTPFVSLGYIAGLILILKKGGARAMSPFAAAGRMAFTNYLSQSLIMTSIFYGGRGALMGQIDRPGLWALVIAIWALQLVWSPLWLSKFEMGPFEWVWRCLTYGKRVPFVRAYGRA